MHAFLALHHLGPLQLGLILAAAFAAGVLDAIVGGGGLITTPVLMLMLPGVPVTGALATTKVSSIAGTTGAAIAYARRVEVRPRILAPGMLAALPSAWLGARAVSHLDPSVVKPAILAVMIAMALYTWWRPDLGLLRGKELNARVEPWIAAAVGAALGFYDGFLGPGTGSLLVLAFIVLFGRDFLGASAQAKFFNWASNLGALLWFTPSGSVLWVLAVPMAACNLLGGVVGSRLAILSGNRWIRRIFLAVVLALIARLGWNLYG
jgi:uncharacterized membrane protein YfcA